MTMGDGIGDIVGQAMAKDIFDQQLADELALEMKILPARPSGFGITTDEFALKIGCSDNHARHKLDAMFRAGTLKRTNMRLPSGGRGFVYHREELV